MVCCSVLFVYAMVLLCGLMYLVEFPRVDRVDFFIQVSASVSTSPCTPLVKRLRVEACRQASRDKASRPIPL